MAVNTDSETIPHQKTAEESDEKRRIIELADSPQARE